jgi:protein-S-isoprenylcysteine O-methyltransferase Ste14
VPHSALTIWLQVSWYALCACWLVTGFATKRATRSEAAWQTWIRYLLLATMFYFLLEAPPPSAFLRYRLIPESLRWQVAGIALSWVGNAFAIWARLALGGNWSSKVAIKADHRLIVRGPYRIVRNPIYTGIFFALVGTAIALGQVRHFLGIPVLLAVWTWKIETEQRFLQEQFGEEYVRYRRNVKAFLPYVI